MMVQRGESVGSGSMLEVDEVCCSYEVTFSPHLIGGQFQSLRCGVLNTDSRAAVVEDEKRFRSEQQEDEIEPKAELLLSKQLNQDSLQDHLSISVI